MLELGICTKGLLDLSRRKLFDYGQSFVVLSLPVLLDESQLPPEDSCLVEALVETHAYREWFDEMFYNRSAGCKGVLVFELCEEVDSFVNVGSDACLSGRNLSNSILIELFDFGCGSVLSHRYLSEHAEPLHIVLGSEVDL